MMNRCSCQYSVIWPICSDGAVQPYVVNKQCKFFLLLLRHRRNSPRDSSWHKNIVHNKYILLFITRQPPYYKNGTGHNLQPGSINKFMGRFSFLSSSTPLRYKQKNARLLHCKIYIPILSQNDKMDFFDLSKSMGVPCLLRWGEHSKLYRFWALAQIAIKSSF